MRPHNHPLNTEPTNPSSLLDLLTPRDGIPRKAETFARHDGAVVRRTVLQRGLAAVVAVVERAEPPEDVRQRRLEAHDFILLLEHYPLQIVDPLHQAGLFRFEHFL